MKNNRPLYKARIFTTSEIVYYYSIDELESFVLNAYKDSKYSTEDLLDYTYRLLREQGFVYIKDRIITKVETEDVYI